MEKSPLKIEKIAGVHSAVAAANVFVGKITLLDETLGTLVSCILVANGRAQDPVTIAKDIFELSCRKLEGAEVSAGILAAVTFAQEAAIEYVRGKDLEVAFGYLFFFGDVCYITKFGDAVKVFVARPPRHEELTFEFGSGPANSGEIFLVATKKLLSIFKFDSLMAANADLSEIIDGLATEISAHGNQDEMAAAFVLVGEGKEEAAKVVESERILQEEEEVEGGSSKVLGKFLGMASSLAKAFLQQLKALARGDIRALFKLRRNIIALAVVIACLLLISVGLAIRGKIEKDRLYRFNNHLSAASAKYNEGVALVELNRLRAREKLFEADRQVKAALSIDKKDERARTLGDEILAKLKETEAVAGLSFSTFFEADLPFNSLSVLKENIMAFSQTKVLQIAAGGGSASEVTIPEGTVSGFGFGESVFVAGEKIYKVDLASGKEEEIGQAAGGDLAVFLGNVYLLGENQIAKIVPVEGGYAPAINYLAQEINFGADSQMTIDGFVWVASGSRIFKFLRGEDQNFEISGLGNDDNFGPIYTNANLENLYVVDRTNSALLVIDKEGTYKKAYQSPEFAAANDLLVTDDGAKLYLAVGSKILQASL